MNEVKYKRLEEAKKEAEKKRRKMDSETIAQIRRMDREQLEAKLEMRKAILRKISSIYDTDLALLEEAQREMDIFNENETKEISK